MRLLFLATVIVFVVILERVATLRFSKMPFFRDYFTTDIIYLISAVALATWMGAIYLAPATVRFEANVAVPSLLRLDWPLPWLVLLGVAAVDFGNFMAHWLMHRFSALWEVHKIHHSALELDWLATFRSHILEQVFRNLLGPAALLVIGFPLDATLIATVIYTAFAVLNHSNTRINLGFIEPVLITPRLHRLHHAPGTTRNNFGTVFTLWDRVAGTLNTRAEEPTELGVPGEVHSYPQTWAPQFVEPARRWFRSRRPERQAS